MASSLTHRPDNPEHPILPPTPATPERDRLAKNAKYLGISGLVTAAMGLVYWMVAERNFDTAQVGRAVVVVSTATMLGTLSGLSLGGMYERFLSSTGHRVRTMIAAGCAVVAGAALLAGGVFALVGSHRLFVTTGERVWFPAVVMAFALFALTDPILVGLRDAGIVASKNISHAIAKLAVLPLVATVSGAAWVIYGSWALLCALASVFGLLWAWKRSASTVVDRPVQLPRLRGLVSHHAAVFTTMLIGMVIPFYLPLVVIRVMDEEHAAWFGVAQVLVGGATLFLTAVHSSYVAEASHPTTDVAAVTRRMVRLTALYAGIGAVGLAVVGPFLLYLVGPAYRENAMGYLVLMALVMVPQTVVGGYGAMSRVRSRLRIVVAVQVAIVILMVGLTPWATREWGLTGIGWVFLAVETAGCLVVLVPCARTWRILTRR